MFEVGFLLCLCLNVLILFEYFFYDTFFTVASLSLLFAHFYPGDCDVNISGRDDNYECRRSLTLLVPSQPC